MSLLLSLSINRVPSRWQVCCIVCPDEQCRSSRYFNHQHRLVRVPLPQHYRPRREIVELLPFPTLTSTPTSSLYSQPEDFFDRLQSQWLFRGATTASKTQVARRTRRALLPTPHPAGPKSRCLHNLWTVASPDSGPATVLNNRPHLGGRAAT